MSPRALVATAIAVIALGATMVLHAPGAVAGPAPVGLGTADSFAVLAGTGITNTGATTITGDVGTFPTTTESGFGTVTITGTNHAGDDVTKGAKDDLVAAYDNAAARTPATSQAVELGGKTLFAGVYSGGTFGLTGTLTLDAQGDPAAQFVFQSAATVIAEAGSRVELLNGADPCRVVWQVTSSATFKTGSHFVGDVLALTSITAQAGATFRGRLLARNGAVALDTNTITNADCANSAVPSGTPTATASTSGSPTAGPVATTSGTSNGTTPTLVPGRAPGPSPSARPVTPLGGPPSRTVATPPGRPRLPVTGAYAAALLATGFGLVALGVLALHSARRRGLSFP
jgi:hypothetical protein